MISYVSLLEGNCNLRNLEQSSNSILSSDVLKGSSDKKFCYGAAPYAIAYFLISIQPI